MVVLGDRIRGKFGVVVEHDVRERLDQRLPDLGREVAGDVQTHRWLLAFLHHGQAERLDLCVKNRGKLFWVDDHGFSFKVLRQARTRPELAYAAVQQILARGFSQAQAFTDRALRARRELLLVVDLLRAGQAEAQRIHTLTVVLDAVVAGASLGEFVVFTQQRTYVVVCSQNFASCRNNHLARLRTGRLQSINRRADAIVDLSKSAIRVKPLVSRRIQRK